MSHIEKMEMENPIFETPGISKNPIFETLGISKNPIFETPGISKNPIFEDDLDISWIHSYQKETHIDENLHREPIKDIMLYFVYINKHSEIHKVFSEKYVFDVQEENSNNGTQSISNMQVLQWIQAKKSLPSDLNSKYKIMDLLFYYVDIEPDKIQSYSNADAQLLTDLSSGFFKVLSLFHNIVIPPSIFIFHPLNALYFLFKEQDSEGKKEIKSILKTNMNMNTKTKKRKDDNNSEATGIGEEVEPVLKKTYTKKVRFA
jgi:hypothetical protein